jgi:hypothetical protein
MAVTRDIEARHWYWLAKILQSDGSVLIIRITRKNGYSYPRHSVREFLQDFNPDTNPIEFVVFNSYSPRRRVHIRLDTRPRNVISIPCDNLRVRGEGEDERDMRNLQNELNERAGDLRTWYTPLVMSP